MHLCIQASMPIERIDKSTRFRRRRCGVLFFCSSSLLLVYIIVNSRLRLKCILRTVFISFHTLISMSIDNESNLHETTNGFCDFEIRFRIHTVISLGGQSKNYCLFIGLFNLFILIFIEIERFIERLHGALDGISLLGLIGIRGQTHSYDPLH